MGSGKEKMCTESEKRARLYARRSVVSLRKIKKGELFTKENIGCKRPGTGISPTRFNEILGAVCNNDLEEDVLLSEKDI